MATDAVVQDVVIVTAELVVQDGCTNAGESLSQTRVHEPAVIHVSFNKLYEVRHKKYACFTFFVTRNDWKLLHFNSL